MQKIAEGRVVYLFRDVPKVPDGYANAEWLEAKALDHLGVDVATTIASASKQGPVTTQRHDFWAPTWAILTWRALVGSSSDTSEASAVIRLALKRPVWQTVLVTPATTETRAAAARGLLNGLMVQ